MRRDAIDAGKGFQEQAWRFLNRTAMFEVSASGAQTIAAIGMNVGLREFATLGSKQDRAHDLRDAFSWCCWSSRSTAAAGEGASRRPRSLPVNALHSKDEV